MSEGTTTTTTTTLTWWNLKIFPAYLEKKEAKQQLLLNFQFSSRAPRVSLRPGPCGETLHLALPSRAAAEAHRQWTCDHHVFAGQSSKSCDNLALAYFYNGYDAELHLKFLKSRDMDIIIFRSLFVSLSLSISRSFMFYIHIYIYTSMYRYDVVSPIEMLLPLPSNIFIHFLTLPYEYGQDIWFDDCASFI